MYHLPFNPFSLITLFTSSSLLYFDLISGDSFISLWDGSTPVSIILINIPCPEKSYWSHKVSALIIPGAVAKLGDAPPFGLSAFIWVVTFLTPGCFLNLSMSFALTLAEKPVITAENSSSLSTLTFSLLSLVLIFSEVSFTSASDAFTAFENLALFTFGSLSIAALSLVSTITLTSWSAFTPCSWSLAYVVLSVWLVANVVAVGNTNENNNTLAKNFLEYGFIFPSYFFICKNGKIIAFCS